MIKIQEFNKTKVSFSHAGLVFITGTSLGNITRAIKSLSKLGLITIHPGDGPRDVNSYSMPNIDILFEKIRQLNLKYIEETKPNQKNKIVEIFIQNNQKSFKSMQDEISKKEDTKELTESSNQGLLEVKKPLLKEKLQVHTVTRSKYFYQMLHKLGFFNIYQEKIEETKDLTEEEIISFAYAANKRGKSKIGLFISLTKKKMKHLVKDDDVNQL